MFYSILSAYVFNLKISKFEGKQKQPVCSLIGYTK